MSTQTTDPIMIQEFVENPNAVFTQLLAEVPWVREQARRAECFMAHEPTTYKYLDTADAPVYSSIAYHPIVAEIETQINTAMGCRMDLCFLNYYENQHQALGWHADDGAIIDQTQPIVVVSFGAVREIWTRPSRLEDGVRISHKGEIPPEWRHRLGNGSVFVMPPGFQLTHQHKIPKGDREMGGRISLTYRSLLRD
jgi:alkylated DNA repair dioxygenase AlkB